MWEVEGVVKFELSLERELEGARDEQDRLLLKLWTWSAFVGCLLDGYHGFGFAVAMTIIASERGNWTCVVGLYLLE